MQDTDERLRQAIRAGNIGIFEHDHRTDTVYWSLELRRMYGWDAEEPATLPKIIGHVHPDDVARVVAAVQAAHDPSGEGAFDIEHRMLDRAGALRWVLTRSKTQFEEVAGTRTAIRTIGAVQDVSDRKAAEERLRILEAQLIHSQKIESIGRLAGGIAHDFNNLLTVISGGLELTLADLPADHRDREPLAAAANAAQSAAALTRQLLAFSRKEVITPKVLDLNAIIERVEKMILRLVGEDIAVSTVCAKDLARIRFDPAQVEQIIVNLAVNARDAMPGGGRLTIETSNVHLGAEYAVRHLDVKPGDYVLLAVSDDGAGMSDDVRSHLFEPFFTTKEAGKGTGLGLAMVYGAVKQNGGRIEVYSEPGRGTTFKIYLPAQSGAQDALPQTPSLPAARSTSILLVEDDARVRVFAQNALTRLGHTVHAYSNGEDAVAAVSALHPAPQVLITDIVLPGMNGRVLAERVASTLPTIRVLFASGYTQNAIVTQGVLEDGIEFLAKPYSVEQLARRIAELVNSTPTCAKAAKTV